MFNHIVKNSFSIYLKLDVLLCPIEMIGKNIRCTEGGKIGTGWYKAGTQQEHFFKLVDTNTIKSQNRASPLEFPTS